MARGRMLVRSIATNDQLADLASDTHRLLFTLAVPHLDRDGRMTADPRRFRGIVAPLLEHLSVDDCRAALSDMIERELVVAYLDERGQKVLAFPGFKGSQPGLRYDREPASSFGSPAGNVAGKLPSWLRQSAGKLPAGNRQAAGKGGANHEKHTLPAERRQAAGSVSVEEKRREGKRSEVKVARARQPLQHPDPQVLQLAQAIAAEPLLEELDAVDIAEGSIHLVQTGGRRMSWLLAAVTDCATQARSARAAGDPWAAGYKADRLARYLKAARRPTEVVDESAPPATGWDDDDAKRPPLPPVMQRHLEKQAAEGVKPAEGSPDGVAAIARLGKAKGA